jgi:hypothetical protein
MSDRAPRPTAAAPLRAVVRLAVAAPLVAALLSGLAPPRPAAAADGACEPVIAAMRAMKEAAAYHAIAMVTAPDGSKREAETIVLDKMAYVRPAVGTGAWHELPLKGWGQGDLASMLEKFPPTDCRAEPDESLDGVATRVFRFTQPVGNPPRPAVSLYTAIGVANSTSRLWVDAGSGRPVRIETEFGTVRKSMRIDYDNVRAPAR